MVVAGDTIEARRALVGVRVDEGLSWLAEALARTLGGEAQPLSCPEHALPAHPVGDGGAFDIAGLEGHLGALAAWFGNAHDMLTDLVRDRSDGAPVRVWPHHFDIATLVTLADTGDAETSKSVSVGLSPGDDSYDEPYWYVSPWPYPDPRRDDLPIGAGHWHTDGFYAAVLTASEMGDADQANRARDFIDQAFAASVGLLS